MSDTNWWKSQSTYICRVQSSVWRLPKILTPHPLSTQRMCPPLAPKEGGGYTLAGGEGVGVNILEDARHWIGLLQFNPSTMEMRQQHAIALCPQFCGSDVHCTYLRIVSTHCRTWSRTRGNMHRLVFFPRIFKGTVYRRKKVLPAWNIVGWQWLSQ
jgi:hypothetical protein